MTGKTPGLYQLLQDLEKIDKCGNLYGGNLVSELGHCKNLTHVNFPNNLFEGVIPSQLGQLTLLEGYNVSGNVGLNGTLPSELGLLTQLTSLDLSNTDISGEIPSPLCERVEKGSLEIVGNCSLLICCEL